MLKNSLQRLEENMEYKVVLTAKAELHFRNIIYYLLHELESQQAAASVMDDFEETVDRLSYIAGSLKLCDDEQLRSKGYRTIHFRRHKYLMVYSIDDDAVYVEGIYHDMQDYENIVK